MKEFILTSPQEEVYGLSLNNISAISTASTPTFTTTQTLPGPNPNSPP